MARCRSCSLLTMPFNWTTPWVVSTLMDNALTIGSARKLDFTLVVMVESSINPPVLSRPDLPAQLPSTNAAMTTTAHAVYRVHWFIDARSSSGLTLYPPKTPPPAKYPASDRDMAATSYVERYSETQGLSMARPAEIASRVLTSRPRPPEATPGKWNSPACVTPTGQGRRPGRLLASGSHSFQSAPNNSSTIMMIRI